MGEVCRTILLETHNAEPAKKENQNSSSAHSLNESITNKSLLVLLSACVH